MVKKGNVRTTLYRMRHQMSYCTLCKRKHRRGSTIGRAHKDFRR